MIKLYYYKGKPYSIITEAKFKLNGLYELPFILELDYFTDADEWIDVVIYQCEYDNPDGKVWVRVKEQFYKLFKTEE